MPHRFDTGRRALPRACALALTALLCCMLVVACGAASHSTSGVGGGASAPAETGESSGAGTPPSAAQLHQQGLAFARCMRSHGVPNFPDPNAGGNFYVGGVNRASPAFRAAQASCRKLMPGGGPPSQTHPSAQTLARFRRIAACMRRHGVPDFPDPRTSAPHLGPGIGEISDIEEVIFVFPSTIDQQAPAFTQAAAACAFPLHNH